MVDSNNKVTLSGIRLDDVLRIVRELNINNIKFTWHYTPPYRQEKREATFEFDNVNDIKYITWLQLKHI